MRLLDLITKYWFRRRTIKKKTPTDIESSLFNWIESLKEKKEEKLLAIFEDKKLKDEFELPENNDKFYSELKKLTINPKSVSTKGYYILSKFYMKKNRLFN